MARSFTWRGDETSSKDQQRAELAEALARYSGRSNAARADAALSKATRKTTVVLRRGRGRCGGPAKAKRARSCPEGSLG